jgi:hypothetical protein
MGSVHMPRTNICLEQGRTAVVQTAEEIALPKGISAIGFPPSTKISLPGLLTTNPGIIDPGFRGKLQLTVINMGSDPFPLKSGDRIMRLLLFRDPAVSDPPDPPPDSPLTEELLSRLSPDFLNVSERARLAAKREVDESGLGIKKWQVWTSLSAAILVAVLAFAGNYITEQDRIELNREELLEKIQNVHADVSRLDAEVNPASGVKALRDLNDRVARIEARFSPSPQPQGKP